MRQRPNIDLVYWDTFIRSLFGLLQDKNRATVIIILGSTIMKKSFRLNSIFVHCSDVLGFKTRIKLKCFQKSLDIKLLNYKLKSSCFLNNNLIAHWNVDLSLVLLHDPEARGCSKHYDGVDRSETDVQLL